jgi:integrase
MTGHIRARSAGSYELRYQADGKTITKTFRGGKREAERELRRLLSLVDNNRHPNDPDRLTVAQWLARWLLIIKPEVAAQTWVNCETAVRVHLIPALGAIQLARLAPGDLQQFYSAIGAGTLMASSARRVCSIFNTAITRAVELRLIAANPGDVVRKRMPRREAPTAIAVLDHLQCAQLLAAARPTDIYAPILTGLATGMRRNEILALQWDHVDLVAGEVHVDESVVHIRGVTTRKAPKNGRSRNITIPAEVVAELRRIRREQAEALLALGVRQDGSTPVCMRGADGTIRSPYSLSDAFTALVKRAGLPACNFHTLRHSHASELMRAGVPVNVAAARLGHSDGGMLLLKTYAHTTDAMARDAATRIGALFGKL